MFLSLLATDIFIIKKDEEEKIKRERGGPFYEDGPFKKIQTQHFQLFLCDCSE